jgi:hypothetical protein
MSIPATPPTNHRLLPHERWLATLVVRRQQAHRPASVLRIEQNYGPDGIALWAAGYATTIPGELIAFIGILLLLLTSDRGRHPAAAYAVIGLGIVLLALSSVRFVQGIRAGRAFRGDRPFLKRSR